MSLKYYRKANSDFPLFPLSELYYANWNIFNKTLLKNLYYDHGYFCPKAKSKYQLIEHILRNIKFLFNQGIVL